MSRHRDSITMIKLRNIDRKSRVPGLAVGTMWRGSRAWAESVQTHWRVATRFEAELHSQGVVNIPETLKSI